MTTTAPAAAAGEAAAATTTATTTAPDTVLTTTEVAYHPSQCWSTPAGRHPNLSPSARRSTGLGSAHLVPALVAYVFLIVALYCAVESFALLLPHGDGLRKHQQ